MSETSDTATPPESPPVLPFTAKSILQICWSLTLILSHEAQQNKLGETFESYFMNVFQQYDNTGAKGGGATSQGNGGAGPKDAAGGRAVPDPPPEGGQAPAESVPPPAGVKGPKDSQPPKNKVEPAFVQNLVMSLAKNVRDIGFVRENHVRYLDFMSQQLGQTIQFYDDVADFTSTSSSSIITKAVSFLGVGSVVDLAAQGNSLTDRNIAIFTIFGLVGAAVITILLKYASNGRIETEYKKVEKTQNDYWRNHFKMDMASQLLIQYKEYAELVERYYPDQFERIKKEDSLLSSSEDGAWEVIWNDILPSDRITWPPFIASQPPSTASSSQQTPATPKSAPAPASPSKTTTS